MSRFGRNISRLTTRKSTIEGRPDTFDVRTEGDDYCGTSYVLIPIAVDASNPDEANAKLDAVSAAVDHALVGTPGRLAIRPGDASHVMEACVNMVAVYRAVAQAQAARQARDN